MRLTFAPEAVVDLANIQAWIAARNPAAAAAMIERIRSRCAQILVAPAMGRARPELGVGIRSVLENPYVILYRPGPEEAEIVMVVHSARDLAAVTRGRLGKK